MENGVPLIRGLPISNLSDGELLELCVDISVSKPGQLQIILVDGAERLDKESRDRLYAKCKEKGLQLIATRVTDSDALEVTELLLLRNVYRLKKSVSSQLPAFMSRRIEWQT